MKITKSQAFIKSGAQATGIALITTGMAYLSQGNYLLGIFLIVVGLACLYAEKFVGE
ncbi:MAG: hypothetical protein ACTSVW_00375 [Candidatus Njordarchaeales archaeon]